MKNIILALIFVLFSGVLNSQEKTDALKGKPSLVKKYYLLSFKKNKKWADGKIQSEFDTHFNRDGRVVKEIEKNDKNVVAQKNYIYRNETETAKFCSEIAKNMNKSTSFTDIQTTPLGVFCKKELNAGTSIKIQFNLTPQEKTQKPFRTFFYVKKSKQTEETVFDSENNFEYKTVHKYDKKGNPLEKTKYDMDSRQMEKEVYKYSFSPLSVTRKYFDSNDILKKEILEEYRMDNTLRKVTETTYDDLEQVFSRTETGYDTSGFKAKETSYSQDNTPQHEYRYEHEYDSAGNWTKEIRRKKTIIYDKAVDSETPPDVIKREIEYYPGKN